MNHNKEACQIKGCPYCDTTVNKIFAEIKKNQESMNNGLIYDYTRQMAENHARKVDEIFWLVVKQKPKWMPAFLYRAVIKELVEFQQHINRDKFKN